MTICNKMSDLTRQIENLEYRTPQEVFDIMVARIAAVRAWNYNGSNIASECQCLHSLADPNPWRYVSTDGNPDERRIYEVAVVFTDGGRFVAKQYWTTKWHTHSIQYGECGETYAWRELPEPPPLPGGNEK